MSKYTCTRCNGKGRIGHYNHIDDGICFACGGSGKVARKPRPKVFEPEITEETIQTTNRIIAALNEGKVVKCGTMQIKLVPHMVGNFEFINEFGNMGMTLLGLQSRIQHDNFIF